jgi:diguanylate cyclase
MPGYRLSIVVELALVLGLCFAGVSAFVALSKGGWPALDLTSLTVLKAVKTDPQGLILTTTYNPLAIALPILLTVAGLAGMGASLARTPAASEGAPTKAAAQVSSQLSAELSKVLGFIRSHLGTSETYAQSLANAQSRLMALDVAAQVRVIVNLLVAENERMRIDVNALKGKLEASHSRVEGLQESLKIAEELVLQDPLTSLGNRRRFDDILEKSVQEAKASHAALSLIMCDLDNFKVINDSHGHAIGDDVLRMFARLLAESVRDTDTVARVGGEEFGLILPETAQTSAASLAERLRRKCETKQLLLRNTNKSIGRITASFGVVQLSEHEHAQMLLQRADQKLYEAKRAGRNRVAS